MTRGILLGALSTQSEDHQIVSQDSQATFTILRLLRFGSQGRTEKTLIPGDRTLDLPAIAVDPFMESAFHLSPVFCSRPLSASTAFVQRDHRRTNSKAITAKIMVVFAIVGRIRQEAVKANVPRRQNHGLGKLWRIVAGTLRGDRRDKHVPGLFTGQSPKNSLRFSTGH